MLRFAVEAPETVEPDPVTPFANATPLSYHWYVKTGVPVAVTEKFAVAPGGRVRLDGWAVIAGSVTVNVAPLLVTDPYVFVTTQE